MSLMLIADPTDISGSLLGYARDMRALAPKQCGGWLLAEYLGRHGREFAYTPQLPRLKPKQCFENAAITVARYTTLDYVEGIAFREAWPIALAHAWCAPTDGDLAYDVTLENAHECRFFGVRFSAAELVDELFAKSTYGLFADEMTVNAALLFRLDPTLRDLLPSD